MEVDPLVGTLVAERYRIVRKLGEGGMGVVYQAVHEALRKPVAIKLLAAAGRIDKEAIARFEREAIAAANLRHPNIAEATDFGRLPDGALYLVMEYVEGTTLRNLLREQGKLGPERALGILQQVAGALATAHARDVVHRDLKPENVIVVSGEGGVDVVKVIDFGIAKIRGATFGAGSAALTRAGTVFGTPEYMAPEQVMGQAADARADQYALGVLTFELLTGKPPFHAEDMGQLMMMHVGAPIPSTRERTPTLSVAVDGVVTKMLGKLPDDRYGSVGEAMAALAAAFSGAAAWGAPRPAMASLPSLPGGSLPSIPGGSMPSIPGATVRLGVPQSGPMVVQAVSSPSLPSATQAMTPQSTLKSIAIEPARQDLGATGSMAAGPPSGAYAAGSMTAGPQSGAYAAGSQPTTSSSSLPRLTATGSALPKANVPNAGNGANAGSTANAATAGAKGTKLPLLAIVLVLISLIGGALVVVLFVRGCSSGDGSVTPAVAAALSDWKSGKFNPAAVALRGAVTGDPKLADDVVVARTLAGSVGDETARRVLENLLKSTALGQSTAMAAALATVALEDAPAARDGALELLRERQELLGKEQGARVRLRDADDCEALRDATIEATEIATSATQSDLERVRSPECKKLLRVRELCDECKGGSGGPGLGKDVGPGKGKGKTKDKKKKHDD